MMGWLRKPKPPKPPLTEADVRAILDRIKFLDRSFRLIRMGDGFALQVTYLEADVETGRVEEQRSRKWYVSTWMTESEVVETAFAAVQRSMLHVIGEHFTYRGRRIYSPHFAVAARLRLCDEHAFDVRPPP